MNDNEHGQFIRGLHQAWQREQVGARIYRALAEREPTEVRRAVLLKFVANEEQLSLGRSRTF